MSQKTCQLIFCYMFVKYEPISIKSGRHVLEETFNKTVQNGPLHLKYVLALPREIWGDRWNHQSSTYMYIVKHVVSNIIFTIHARNVHLQRVRRSQMSTNWDNASRTSKQSESRCSLNVRLASTSLAFVLQANISSIGCKDNVTCSLTTPVRILRQ